MSDVTTSRPSETYEEVANAMTLDSGTARRYVRYMRGRSWRGEELEHCLTGYAAEWAARFKEGIEYEMSDPEGQALLDVMSEEEKRR